MKGVPEIKKEIVMPPDADATTKGVADMLKNLQAEEGDELMGQIER